MKYLVCVLCLCGTVFLHSCLKDKGPIPVVNMCDSVSATYSADIEPIINTKCAVSGCHTATGGNNIPLATYAQVKAKVDNGSLENRVLTLANMPPGGSLPADEKAKIECWLEAAAPNN